MTRHSSDLAENMGCTERKRNQSSLVERQISLCLHGNINQKADRKSSGSTFLKNCLFML